MLQEQFNQMYDRLLKYAFYKAGRYFRDETLRQDAADEALNEAVDTWIRDGCYDEEVAKRVIQSSLRQASRKRSVEPISVEEEGTHGYKII
jgi:polyhydroxyalkanoate synthesis regulator phasin